MALRRDFLSSAVAMASLPIVSRTGLSLYETAKPQSRVMQGRNVAATVHPLASQAAAKAMSKGGNAIDAAVVASLCLGVVDGHNSGIGGGGLMMIRLANGTVMAIDGREKAPRAASKDMFLRNGVADPTLSQDGPLACGVPGLVAALHAAHSRYGKLPWSDLFEPAIRAARDGVPLSRTCSIAIQGEQETIRRFPASAAVLLNKDGSPLRSGDTLVQRDLGDTLESIAQKGSSWFYRGPFAESCVRHLQSQGGILTLDDFANYAALDRTPLWVTYRNLKVAGFPPPSSGGIHILQMLNILSRFDLKALYQEDSGWKFYHLLAEAMKLAFADRAHYLGDSDFVEVPAFLTEKSYADRLAETIHMDRASKVAGPLGVGKSTGEDNKKHTTHLTTADEAGNWVALTQTINTSWGNKMIVPGTGVVLNDEMDDFSSSPGVPNAFGLIGSAANAIAPGKRPLSSMSPTLVIDADDRPLMSCGAAGGPRIINATLQVLLRCIDLGESIGDAIAASRVHHQWSPDTLSCEASLGHVYARNAEPGGVVFDRLRDLGHEVKIQSTIAIAQGIQRGSDGKSLMAACDPRADGMAASDV